VLSERDGTLTVDAGSKAIAPDIPMTKRFIGVDEILNMKEEHTVIKSSSLVPGDRVALVPRHTCTTAYLYRRALVLTREGKWEYREQLGCER
jgi:3-hydroxy-D-aspartate aldolase